MTDGPSFLVTKRTVELFSSTHSELLVEGGVGGGKTFTGGVFIDSLCRLYPGIRILLVRQTRISLNTSVLDTLEDEVWGSGHPVLTPTRARSSRQAYVYPLAETKVAGKKYRGRSRIDLGGLDNPDRIMSTQYDVIWFVEATEGLQGAWERLSTRVRRFYVTRFGKPFSLMIADCNPASRRHWLNLRADKPIRADKAVLERLGITETEAEGLTQMQRIRMTLKDNPKFWDSERDKPTEQGAAYLLRLGGVTGVDYDRLILSLWVDTSGAVYPGFHDDRHIVMGELVTAEEAGREGDYRKWWLRPKQVKAGSGSFAFDPSFEERAVAWFGISVDQGFNPDPTVVQLWAVDMMGHAFRVKLWYKTRTTFDEWARLVAELQRTYDVRTIVTDGGKEAAATLNALLSRKLNDRGDPIAIPAKKGPGSIREGINKVRWALKDDETTGEPRIRFFAGALQHEPDTHLESMFWPTDDIQEFDRYAYAEADDEKPSRDEPKDKHNHGMDAMRYFVSYVWSNTHAAVKEPEPAPNIFTVKVGLTERDMKRKRLEEARAMRSRRYQ